MLREQVLRDSPIVAELRTNVIVKDEFTLVRDLSIHLAARYTRPDSATMVQVDHSACLALGGTFDPCYILTLTTGPSQMGPTMNKRNAALIQSFMADLLGVPPERGVVKFHAVPEENFAHNGTTLLGEIERREKQHDKPKLVVNSNSDEPVLVAIEPKTLTAMRPKSATLPLGASATILSPAGVYELPAVEMERKPPPTSGLCQTSNGSNGLRMNPVSNSAPDSKRKSSSGRPAPISGEPLVREKRKSNSHLLQSRSSMQATPPPPPPPPPVQHSSSAKPTFTSPPKQQRPHSFLRNEYTKSGHRQSRSSNANRMSAPIAIREKPMRMLGVRDSYVEGLMGKPHLINGLEADDTIPKKPSQELPGQEPTANTAKRRSTMTATPKMPETLMLPEVSDSNKSVKSTKTGKRKSFMAAFKRTVATT